MTDSLTQETVAPSSALPKAAELDELTDSIVAALKTVYDPEIPADIYELGLIYNIDVDDSRVFIGSENFSIESMQYNRELGLVISSPQLTSSVTETLENDFERAQPWYA